MYTMGIKLSTGLYNCFRCSSSGNWKQFKNYLTGNVQMDENK
jgi:hypothetical protein